MKQRLRQLITSAHVLYLAVRDGRTPIHAKLFGVFALSWVFFPGDFDFIPVLGWLDDGILLTLAIGLVSLSAPDEVIAESKEKSPKRLKNFAIKAIGGALLAALCLALLMWMVFG